MKNKSHPKINNNLTNKNLSKSIQKQLTSNLQNHHQLNQTSNGQLQQIIQSLILKSRQLIKSLQSTLKQLQQTKQQKQYWKNHYFNFKRSCQKYIQSRGLAPFQYINELQKSLKLSNFKLQQNYQLSTYKPQASQTIIKDFTDLYSQKQFKTQNKFQYIHLPVQKIQIKDIIRNMNNSHSEFNSGFIKTVEKNKKVQDPFKRQQKDQISNRKIQNFNRSIKLGGSNRKQVSKDDKFKVNNQCTQNRANFRRKDSLQTKRIDLISSKQICKLG